MTCPEVHLLWWWCTTDVVNFCSDKGKGFFALCVPSGRIPQHMVFWIQKSCFGSKKVMRCSLGDRMSS